MGNHQSDELSGDYLNVRLSECRYPQELRSHLDFMSLLPLNPLNLAYHNSTRTPYKSLRTPAEYKLMGESTLLS